MYRSSKTYGHEIGLSCCFRNHHADSHCHFLHSYNMVFEIEYAGSWTLAAEALILSFRRCLLVSADDPLKKEIIDGLRGSVASVKVLPGAGCERLAEYVFEALRSLGTVEPLKVQVREHEANGAAYVG